jgi:hypothetical protein
VPLRRRVPMRRCGVSAVRSGGSNGKGYSRGACISGEHAHGTGARVHGGVGRWVASGGGSELIWAWDKAEVKDALDTGGAVSAGQCRVVVGGGLCGVRWW